MDNQIAENLARNASALRQKKAHSQATLAKLAGIPRSTINHIESGRGNPSLANLLKLAGALQVSIEELLSRPRPRTKLMKATDVPKQKRSQATIYKLLPDPVRGMEMDRMELDPRGRLGGIPHLPGTKEYLACIQGQMIIHVGGESHGLAAGDVLAFPGDQAHSYQNPSDRKSVCVSVVVLS